MTGVSVKVGRPDAAKTADVTAQLSADLVKALGEAVIERVRARVNHPAADALTVSGVNQNAALIGGPRGGPGVIRPVKAKALRFTSKSGGIVFAKSVNGVGLGPLIESEANLLAETDVILPNKTYE